MARLVYSYSQILPSSVNNAWVSSKDGRFHSNVVSWAIIVETVTFLKSLEELHYIHLPLKYSLFWGKMYRQMANQPTLLKKSWRQTLQETVLSVYIFATPVLLSPTPLTEKNIGLPQGPNLEFVDDSTFYIFAGTHFQQPTLFLSKTPADPTCHVPYD